MLEIEENLAQIKEFRTQYNIPEETYSDKRLLKALKKYKNNYDTAFASLYVEK